MKANWDEELQATYAYLNKRYPLIDADTIAGAVARFWYWCEIKGHRPCAKRIRWCLYQELRGEPFPGLGQAHGHWEAYRHAQRRPLKLDVSRRFPPPDHTPTVADECRWIRARIRGRAERLAVAAVEAGELLEDVSKREGYHPQVVGSALSKLRRRCRQLRS